MMKVVLVLLAVFPLVTSSDSASIRGFLMTASNEFTIGKQERLCFTFTDVDADINVDVSLVLETSNKNRAAETHAKKYAFKKGMLNQCVHFMVPVFDVDKYTMYKLEVVGSSAAPDVDYKFNETVRLKGIKPQGLVTFIQTDKPIYKPGQNVKFRILTVNQDLLPAGGDILEEVWIKDPNDNRIMQWKNTKTKQGLGDFEIPLSEQPILGIWSIHVKSGLISESLKFQVKEYVLPKFKVTVVPPAFVYISDQEVKGKVCAAYTYGKPVVGKVEIIVGIKQQHRHNSGRPSFPITKEIDHCVEFTISADDLQLRKSSFSLWMASVKIFASVTEGETGITQNSTAVSKIEMQRFKVDNSFMQDYFKPGLPYVGKGILKKPDGTPAAFKEITLNIRGKKTTQILTNEKGVFMVYIPDIGAESKTINIQVKYEEPDSSDYNFHRMRGTYSSKTIRNWYSRSGYAVQIMGEEETLTCGKKHEVNVTYLTMTDTTTKFFYQVITKRGDVVQKGHISHYFKRHDYLVSVELPMRLKRDISEPHIVNEDSNETNTVRNETVETHVKPKERSFHVSHFKIKIDVTADLAGGSRLLVFQIRPDGEIIADSQEFDVENCFRNKVSMKFNKDQGLPGSPVTLQMKAAPGSLCSIGLVDKSVYLLQAGKQLTPEKLYAAIESFSVKPNFWPGNTDHCDNIGPQPPPIWPRQPRFQDNLPQPMLRRQKRSNIRTSNYFDSSRAFLDIGIVIATDFDIVKKPTNCEPYYRVMAMSLPGPDGDNLFVNGEVVQDVNFKNSPTFKRKKAKKEKNASVRSYFPETWLFDIEIIGNDGELKLKKTLPHTITEWIGSSFCTNPNVGMGVSDLTKIKGFQPFFVSFNLPYSVIRGEKVPIMVSVFNYLTECLVIDLRLKSTADYKIKGPADGQVCVCANKQKVHTFFIVPATLGKINITVNAVSSDNSFVCGNTIVPTKITGEGASDAVVRKLLVEPEGIEQEYSLSSLICPDGSDYSTTLDLNLPSNLIPDSARAHLAVVGDLMGPTLSGLDKLLTVPYGCGEQNMITFTPNIFVLKYLTATQQLTAKVQQKALSHMRKGYQRELTYQHDDGSYSAFGNRDPSGSMWLSAFVVKSFAQSKPYIYIDDMHLQKTISWFRNKQLENGCFPQIGRVLHKDMKGGLGKGSSTAGLTAFVLIAMLEAGLGPESSAVQRAVWCINSQTVDQTDSYIVALLAYAYSLYNPQHEKSLHYLSILSTLSVNQGGLKHWERAAKPPVELSDSWMPHHQAASADVELTSYALMAVLNHRGSSSVTEALPIIKWLTKQRNANGGFTSTQDTIVALQALAQYSMLVHKTSSPVYITPQGSKLMSSTLTVNNDNRLLLQTVNLQVPDLLMVSANGTGCALLQANVKYNIKESIKEKPAFTLDVVVSNKPGECKKRTLGICTSYTKKDDESNMAIVEIRMVSGWIPIKDSITKLLTDSEEGLKKYEINKNYVQLYFNEISSRGRFCFFVDVEQFIDIEFAKPGYVKIYDYYETDMKVIKDYVLHPNCGKKHTNTKEDLPHIDQREFDRLSNQDKFVGQIRVPVKRIDPIALRAVPAGVAKVNTPLPPVTEPPIVPARVPVARVNTPLPPVTEPPIVPARVPVARVNTPLPPVTEPPIVPARVPVARVNTPPSPVTEPPIVPARVPVARVNTPLPPVTEPPAVPARVAIVNTPLSPITEPPKETMEPAREGCPVCVTTDSAAIDLVKLFCDHDEVYKAAMRRNNLLKLMAKFGKNIRGKMAVNRFALYQMESTCNCDFFENEVPVNRKYALFVNKDQLADEGRHLKLTFTDNTIALPLTKDIESQLYHMWKRDACVNA